MAAVLSWIMDSSDYVERSPLFPNPLVCLRDMAQTGAYEVSYGVHTHSLATTVALPALPARVVGEISS